MADNTTKLQLYKADPSVDGSDTFNFDTLLNENWDKIDQNARDTSNKTGVLTDLQTTDKTSLVNAINELKNQGVVTSALEAKLANHDREIAYLNLKQAAADRIENGTTFADDFDGNSFNATFDEANSTGVTKRNGDLLMLESTMETTTVTDAIVTPNAYDTSGNGGRKLVRLDNGWIVSAVYDTTLYELYFYRSKDNGETWSLLYTLNSSQPIQDYSLVSNGNLVHFVNSYDNSRVFGRSIDGSLDSPPFIDNTTLDSAQSALGNVSITRNAEGTELHAAWSSKNSTYPNSFNIRYAKGTINADGSVTWGAVEQVTGFNTSGNDHENPSIITVSNGEKKIITKKKLGSTYYISLYAEGSGSSTTSDLGDWGFVTIYSDNYTQSSPSAIFVPSSVNGLPQGRIWVAWLGTDSTDTMRSNIRVSYSDDGGVNWSAMQKLTSGNDYTQHSPSITVNKNNKVFVMFSGYDATDSYADVKVTSNEGTGWSAVSIVKTDSANHAMNPSTLADVNMDFSEPLFIYRHFNTKVGFYGTWNATTETPTTAGTAIYTLESTDEVVAWLKREGSVNVDAYINDTPMDAELVDDEYRFVQSLATAAPITLRFELSRVDITGGENDKLTRLLGGVS